MNEWDRELIESNRAARERASKRRAPPRPDPSRRRRLDTGSIVGLAVLAVVLIVCVRLAAKPMLKTWMIDRQQDKVNRQMRLAVQEYNDLNSDIASLKSPAGKLDAAREGGLLQKGEIPFRTPSSIAAGQSQPRALVKLSRWDRFMLFLCRVCNVTPSNPEAII